MIKEYCDGCGVELKLNQNAVSKRIKRLVKIKKRVTIAIEVLVAVDGTWNGGHACRKCVLNVVDRGADAP